MLPFLHSLLDFLSVWCPNPGSTSPVVQERLCEGRRRRSTFVLGAEQDSVCVCVCVCVHACRRFIAPVRCVSIFHCCCHCSAIIGQVTWPKESFCNFRELCLLPLAPSTPHFLSFTLHLSLFSVFLAAFLPNTGKVGQFTISLIVLPFMDSLLSLFLTGSEC